MKKLEDLISDPGKLEQAKKIVTKCINDGNLLSYIKEINNK